MNGRGRAGIVQGYKSLFLSDADGQLLSTHSISAGLDYPGIGPQLAHLGEQGRITFTTASDSGGPRRGAVLRPDGGHGLRAGVGARRGRGDEDCARLPPGQGAGREHVRPRRQGPVHPCPRDGPRQLGRHSCARRLRDERRRLRIMAHMVAFYPDEARSLDVARGLADGGLRVPGAAVPLLGSDRGRPRHPARLQRRAGGRLHRGRRLRAHRRDLRRRDASRCSS